MPKKLSERRKEIAEKAQQRVKESYDSRGERGGYGSIYKTDEELPFWECKPSKDKHIIDILPYITGEGNPKWGPDELTYVLPIWIHKNVGVNNDRVVCPAKNYSQPCPVCEYLNDAREEMKEEEYKKARAKYKATRRSIYNIISYDSDKETEKGVQIFDVAYFFMENHLSELAKKQRGGGFVPFWEPSKKEGKSVEFKVEDKGEGNVAFTAHSFEARDYDISDEELDSVYCLEDLIAHPSYEEIYEAFWGEPYEGKKGKKRTSSTEEDVPDEKGEDTTSSARSRLRGRGDKKEDKGEEKSDEGRRRLRRPSREEDKKEESSGKEADDDCPEGYVFGEDVDKHKECNKCDVFDKCAARYEELEEEKKEKTGASRRRRG